MHGTDEANCSMSQNKIIQADFFFRQIDHCASLVVVADLVLPAPLKAQFLVARSAPATEFCLSVTNN